MYYNQEIKIRIEKVDDAIEIITEHPDGDLNGGELIMKLKTTNGNINIVSR